MPSSSRVMGCYTQSYEESGSDVSFSIAGCLADRNKKAPRGALFDATAATLRCAGLYFRIDADLVPRAALVLELHDAVDQGVDREIAAEADIATRMPFRAALTDDDVSGDDLLTPELLDATV